MITPVEGYLLLIKKDEVSDSKELKLVVTDFESIVSELYEVVESKSANFKKGSIVIPNEHTTVDVFYDGVKYYLVDESSIIAYINESS